MGEFLLRRLYQVIGEDGSIQICIDLFISHSTTVRGFQKIRFLIVLRFLQLFCGNYSFLLNPFEKKNILYYLSASNVLLAASFSTFVPLLEEDFKFFFFFSHFIFFPFDSQRSCTDLLVTIVLTKVSSKQCFFIITVAV